MNAKPVGPFLGINNRLPDFALHVQQKGDFLRESDNVLVTNKGTIKRRPAAANIVPMASLPPHSLFGEYLVRASSLYKVTLPAYTQTLVKALSSNAPMSYVEFNGSIYFSNGTDSGRIAPSGIVYPWALPTPSSPACAYVAGGSLFAGWYQVAISYSNSVTGEEGGVSPSSNYEMTSAGSLRVTLPTAAITGATHINLYVSTANGSIPLYQAQVAFGAATRDVTVLLSGAGAKRDAVQRYEEPLPAGARIFMHNSRLCSVLGNTLYCSIAHRPGYYIPTEGFIPFPEAIGVAVSNQNGVYITADKTYFFAGKDLGAVEDVSFPLPYGGVPGTEFILPVGTTVGWFCEKGIALADKHGQVTTPMYDNIDLTEPASGMSSVRTDNGNLHVMSCGWCLNVENMAATTFSGYDFTSISDGFGTTADGVWALESSGKVDAHISLGKLDFGTEALKHLPATYLGCASGTPMELRVATPDQGEFSYEARASSTDTKIQRVDPGKGLRANWYDLSVYNTEGSDFTIASVSFAPVASSRKI